MEYFPLFVQLKNKTCLLVGGGDVATRKARLLVKASAVLRVVALDVTEELEQIVKDCGGNIQRRSYDASDLKDVVLAIAATDDHALNAQLSEDAKACNILVNVVDNPSLCTFITPAIIDRSPVIIAISTGGVAPVLARLIRMKLETLIPATYGRLAMFANRFRAQVKETLITDDSRRRFWENQLQGSVAELVFNGQEARAEKLMASELASAKADSVQPQGEVYLVGGGPGDPELLTLKALRLMQQAEVVLYDRLVSPGVMELVRRDAERIYVGKRRENHAVDQKDINQMLVDLAQAGKRVLRLKGGDPFIFGRGGEEIELLAEQNIPFQVVPGITAASGCSAYAGIPLTHRDYAQSVRFVTGHLKSNNPNVNWPELATAGQTLVFYMGLVGLREICEALIQHGREMTTPVALVEKGTTQEQRVLVGNLATMADMVENGNVHGPTLLIVGEVVSLRDSLQWFT